MKTAIITGILGQDGSYLAELLLKKGYLVHGVMRQTVQHAERAVDLLFNPPKQKMFFHSVSDLSSSKIFTLIETVQPDELYHLASNSFVSYSMDVGTEVFKTNFDLSFSIFEAVKRYAPHCKIYFAGSSEMFGNARISPQDENTIFAPRSMYGVMKVACYNLARIYKDKHNVFVSTGFLYNHESPRRREEFVTRKITKGVARIYLGLSDNVQIGNLNAVRDWGWAPDYVFAMHLMLQESTPKDYVIATGIKTSVKTFLQEAFNVVGLDYEHFVRFDDSSFRPGEEITLCGDATKAQNELGWQPTRTLRQIIEEMVRSDIALVQKNMK
jgi:GDPmannose 4,6-dehydratase